jgi:hypothetical protein
MKRTIFQSLGKRAISVLGLAMFSILLGSATAQAQCTVVGYRAVCPIDSDKGYVYDWINNQWHYASYYVGMTTNFQMQYLYPYALWVGTDRWTGVTYAYTIAGWRTLNLQNQALLLLWQMSQNANAATSAPMTQQFINSVSNNNSTILTLIRSMPH